MSRLKIIRHEIKKCILQEFLEVWAQGTGELKCASWDFRSVA